MEMNVEYYGKINIEYDKTARTPCYGGFNMLVYYYITYKGNVYYVECLIMGLQKMKPSLEVIDVQLPEITNQNTLHEDAAKETFQDIIYEL